MAKKQTPKSKAKEADPLGDLMTPEFVTECFREAVEEALERHRQLGLDSYFGTPDGEVFARKPDGRIEKVDLKPKKTNG